MKLSLHFVLVLLFLFPAATAFAGTDTHKGSITLSDSVQVAGAMLAPGEYTVKWDGTGPATEMRISQNGKVLATVPAQVVQLDQKAALSNVELTIQNGVKTMTKIEFEGKNFALQVNNQAAGGSGTAGSDIK